MMQLPGPAVALLTAALVLSACDGEGAGETTVTASVPSTTTPVSDPCQRGAEENQFEVDLDGVSPSELVYVRVSEAASGSSSYELGLCVDGGLHSTVELQAEDLSIIGFVDLDDDGRKEVILQTIEGAGDLVRAATVTLQGLVLTSLAAEKWIDSGGEIAPVGPFTAEGVECLDHDGDGSQDLLVVDYRPAEDLVHIDVASVSLADSTTAVEIGVDSYETDVATAFERWSAPLQCESDTGSTTGIRYGADGWGRVEYGPAFDSRGDLILTAVAHGGDRFVAVGYEQPSPLVGEYFPAGQTLWQSIDGVGWVGASLEEMGELRDVTAVDSRFFAVGHTDRGTAAVWSSSDAEVWELVEVEPAVDGGSARMLGITRGPGGALLAVGVESYRPDPSGPGPDLDAAVWRSEDGEVWQRVESPVLGEVGYQPNADGQFNSEIVSVDYSPDLGYVAVGSASHSGDDEVDFPTQYPAVWVSTDGESWEMIGVPGEIRLRGVTAVEGSVIAYGVTTLHGSPTQDAVILMSRDGVTWTEAEGDFAGLGPNDGVQSINDVVVIPGEGLFALGSDDVEFEAKGAAAVWRAAIDDAGVWSRQQHDDNVFEEVTEAPIAVMTDGVWTGEELLVVGFSGESQVLENDAAACCVYKPAIWIWQTGSSP